MKTSAIVLIAALLGAGTTFAVQENRLSEARDEAATARDDAAGTEAALEHSIEDERRLGRRIERLRSELEQLRAELDEPSLTPTEASLEDGRHAVILDRVDGDSFVFDLIQWLTGDAANEAAVADGVIQEGDSVPNDYYIVNDNPMLRTISIVPGLPVDLSTWDCQNIPTEKTVTFERFGELYSDPARCAQNLVHNPYWITVHEGVVVAMKEQYRP
jgi:hypothetical protein